MFHTLFVGKCNFNYVFSFGTLDCEKLAGHTGKNEILICSERIRLKKNLVCRADTVKGMSRELELFC